MKKKVMREIEVKICDFCGEEVESLEKCPVCKKEGCGKDGFKAHWAYSLEIYRYRDGEKLAGYGSHVCKECTDKKPEDLTIQEFFDKMIAGEAIAIKA